MLRDFLRSRSRSRVWQGRVAEVQTCEPRLLPAGTVLVTFASNTLTIMGDNKGNGIDVDVGTEGVITITGSPGFEELLGTKISFGGTVHPSGVTLTLPKPTAAVGIIVNLLGGSDSLTVSVAQNLGTSQFTKLTVDLGDEDDLADISVGTGTTLNFTDIVRIEGGEGYDVLRFDIDGTVSIAKAFTINSGADNDQIVLGIDGALIGKAATSFLTGDGDDQLAIHGGGRVTFENTLTVATGEDDDSVVFALEQGLIAKAAVTITTADGNDRVEFFNSGATLDFQKGLTADLGTGDNLFVLSQGTLISGLELKVLTGGGDDVVRIAQKLTLNAGLTIVTGDGEDDIDILTGRGSSEDEDEVVANVIKGKLTIDTGEDDDVIGVTVAPQTPLTVTLLADIKMGQGDDFFGLLNPASTVTFTAGLTADLGTGNDVFHLIGEQDFGPVDEIVALAGTLISGLELKVLTGGGDDVVRIAQKLSLNAGLTITTGDGKDAILIVTGRGSSEDEDEVVANVIKGKLTIDTGEDDDVIGVTVAPQTLLTVTLLEPVQELIREIDSLK